jgi:hypothetical protein
VRLDRLLDAILLAGDLDHLDRLVIIALLRMKAASGPVRCRIADLESRVAATRKSLTVAVNRLISAGYVVRTYPDGLRNGAVLTVDSSRLIGVATTPIQEPESDSLDGVATPPNIGVATTPINALESLRHRTDVATTPIPPGFGVATTPNALAQSTNQRALKSINNK